MLRTFAVAATLLLGCGASHTDAIDAGSEAATDADVSDGDMGPWISCEEFVVARREADCFAWGQCQLGGRDHEFFDMDACIPRVSLLEGPLTCSTFADYDGFAAARCLAQPLDGCQFVEAEGWWPIENGDCSGLSGWPTRVSASLGAPCTVDGLTDGGVRVVCPPGTFCDGTCRRVPGEGEPCVGGGGGDDCGPGLACSPSFTGPPFGEMGTCIPMVIGTSEGAPCNDRTMVCDERARLFCDFTTRTCRLLPTGGTGTPCIVWNAAEHLGGPCDIGYACTGTGTETCQPVP